VADGAAPPGPLAGIEGRLPPEMAAKAEADGVAKAGQDAVTLLVLGVLGGAFIAFGAIFSNVALTGAEGALPFGLALFLASVGINAGQPFVRTVAESGFTMLFIGMAVLLTTVAIVLLVGHHLMKIPYDDLVGVASGATGNPSILVYSTRMAPTERPDIGYAMIFPSMTIVKVIAVQIVGLLVAGGAS